MLLCPGENIKLIILQVIGTLKGYDQLMNLVLDDVKETLRGIYSCESRGFHH